MCLYQGTSCFVLRNATTQQPIKHTYEAREADKRTITTVYTMPSYINSEGEIGFSVQVRQCVCTKELRVLYSEMLLRNNP